MQGRNTGASPQAPPLRGRQSHQAPDSRDLPSHPDQARSRTRESAVRRFHLIPNVDTHKQTDGARSGICRRGSRLAACNDAAGSSGSNT